MCRVDRNPSAGALPQTPLGELTALPRPLAGLGVGPRGKRRREGMGKGGRGGEGKEGEGVPESPNQELASLIIPDSLVFVHHGRKIAHMLYIYPSTRTENNTEPQVPHYPGISNFPVSLQATKW